MADEGFIDYFKFAGLDPGDTRQKNYDLLVRKHREKAAQPAQQAKIDTAILSQAMGIFRDPEKYYEYRKRWESQPAASSQEVPVSIPAILIDRVADAVKVAVEKRQPGKVVLKEFAADTFKDVIKYRRSRKGGF